MNTQNILNYNLRKIDLVLDSSEYYDLTLCNDQIEFDRNLLIKEPIIYYSLNLDYNFIYPNKRPETITLSNFDGVLTFTLPFTSFISYFDPNYVNIFLPTDKYTFVIDETVHVLTVTTFNEPISLLPDLTVNQILLLIGKTPIKNQNFDVRNTKPVTPYPQLIKIGDNSLKNIREPRGWTWELQFNPKSLDWSDNSPFLYLGMKGDSEIKNYSDNSLSFGFKSDNTIEWLKTELKEICGDDYHFENLSGKTKKFTPTINEDFLITIVFERYYELNGCNLLNKGGENDYINDLSDITVHSLTKRWLNGTYYRKGRLSIYFNGKLLNHFDKWGELVLSNRGLQPYVVSFGGLTDSNSLHNGISSVDIKKVRYFSEPLKFTYVKHNFLYSY